MIYLGNGTEHMFEKDPNLGIKTNVVKEDIENGNLDNIKWIRLQRSG